MRFYMVDRITEIVQGQSVTARKLATFQDCYMEDAITGQYFFPEALMIEALCQAGAWLVMSSTDFKKRAVLLSADTIEITRKVYPNDELVLHGSIDSLHENAAVFSGYGEVNGIKVMHIKFMMCSLVNTEELENVENTKQTFMELSPEVFA